MEENKNTFTTHSSYVIYYTPITFRFWPPSYPLYFVRLKHPVASTHLSTYSALTSTLGGAYLLFTPSHPYPSELLLLALSNFIFYSCSYLFHFSYFAVCHRHTSHRSRSLDPTRPSISLFAAILIAILNSQICSDLHLFYVITEVFANTFL